MTTLLHCKGHRNFTPAQAVSQRGRFRRSGAHQPSLLDDDALERAVESLLRHDRALVAHRLAGLCACACARARV
jgi:hypothetical protein